MKTAKQTLFATVILIYAHAAGADATWGEVTPLAATGNSPGVSYKEDVGQELSLICHGTFAGCTGHLSCATDQATAAANTAQESEVTLDDGRLTIMPDYWNSHFGKVDSGNNWLTYRVNKPANRRDVDFYCIVHENDRPATDSQSAGLHVHFTYETLPVGYLTTPSHVNLGTKKLGGSLSAQLPVQLGFLGGDAGKFNSSCSVNQTLAWTIAKSPHNPSDEIPDVIYNGSATTTPITVQTCGTATGGGDAITVPLKLRVTPSHVGAYEWTMTLTTTVE